MKIGALQKTSIIEFPGVISCIIFTQGCNFRCHYCHNPELVLPDRFEKPISEDEIFNFLKLRKKYLEGVSITGGEPTIQKYIFNFIKKIKDLDYKIKLDTNGSNPNVLKKIIKYNLLDYISMDIKGPFDKYEAICGTKVNIEKIKTSIEVIKTSNINYEFRTTVVKKLIKISDFEKIGKIIKGAKKYILQKFIPSKLVNAAFLKENTYSDEEFEKIKNIIKNYVEFVEIR